jgi:type IV secretory pathway VirJ component
MRFLTLVSATLALFVANAAQAQTWAEWPSRDDRFVVNFPGEPARTEMQYKTAKGTTLPAHVYTAEADPKSRSAGTYSVTVVDYNSAPDELAIAIADAAKVARTKGNVKYDEENNIDQMRSWRLTVETATNRRILSEILVSAEKRLYIVEANTPINVPPPAQFQASVQILDADGVRIRYRTVGSSERVR